MQLIPTKRSHLSAIKALHAASGYEHSLPPDSTLLTGYVAVLDGEVVAWAGYEPCIQAFYLTNTKELPGLRVETLKMLSTKLADYVTRAMPWIHSAFVWVDANHPRTAKRLRQMGFTKPCGELLEMSRTRALEVLKLLGRIAG